MKRFIIAVVIILLVFVVANTHADNSEKIIEILNNQQNMVGIKGESHTPNVIWYSFETVDPVRTWIIYVHYFIIRHFLRASQIELQVVKKDRTTDTTIMTRVLDYFEFGSPDECVREFMIITEDCGVISPDYPPEVQETIDAWRTPSEEEMQRMYERELNLWLRRSRCTEA